MTHQQPATTSTTLNVSGNKENSMNWKSITLGIVALAIIGSLYHSRSEWKNAYLRLEDRQGYTKHHEEEAHKAAKDCLKNERTALTRIEQLQQQLTAQAVAATKPPTKPEVPAAAKQQVEQNSFDYVLAANEDASLVERACSLRAKRDGLITKLPMNTEELAKSRVLNGVDSNDKLPSKVGATLKTSCDLTTAAGKEAMMWAKHRRRQLAEQGRTPN